MKEQDKDLEYFRKKAAKDYITTPLSVFIYIRELEKATKQINSSNDIQNVMILFPTDDEIGVKADLEHEKGDRLQDMANIGFEEGAEWMRGETIKRLRNES